MGIPWLESVGRKEQAKRETKARQMMFPFGEEQRKAELELLRGLVATRSRDSDLLYQLFSAKAALGPAGEEKEDEGQAGLGEWLRSRLARGFTPWERAAFWALAELERPAQSLEGLPGPEAVRRRADELLTQHAGGLLRK